MTSCDKNIISSNLESDQAKDLEKQIAYLVSLANQYEIPSEESESQNRNSENSKNIKSVSHSENFENGKSKN